MFVEQSAVKIWRVRSAFILLCIAPTLCLSYWAVVRQSGAHREHIADKASRLLGRRVHIESMTYPQLGCLMLSEVTVAGQPFSDVSVVTSGNEVRLTVDSFVPGGDTAACVVGLVKRWLSEPVQFHKNYLIDIEKFSWHTTNSDEEENMWPLRIECVSAGSGRAIRFFKRGSNQDEIRIVRTVNSQENGGHVTEVDVNAADPIPVPLMNSVLSECGSPQWPLGEKATFTGQVHISNGGGDYHQLSGSSVRTFQRLGFGLVVDSKGLQLRALPGRSGCLLESQGLPIILEPTETATLDRLAWLLSGTTPPAVPGTDITAWLLSVLPRTTVLH